MNSRLYSSRIVAIRPVLEGLESRELLSHIAIPDNAKARIATISQLPTAPSQAVFRRTRDAVPQRPGIEQCRQEVEDDGIVDHAALALRPMPSNRSSMRSHQP